MSTTYHCDLSAIHEDRAPRPMDKVMIGNGRYMMVLREASPLSAVLPGDWKEPRTKKRSSRINIDEYE